MWGNLSNIANNASKFLEQLDETIDDTDEQYNSDGSAATMEDPEHSQAHHHGEAQAGMSAEEVSSSKTAVSTQPVGTASMKTVDLIPPPPAGPASERARRRA